MSQEIDIQMSGNEYVRQASGGAQAPSDVQAAESVVPAKRLAVGKLFPDNGINAVCASKVGGMQSPTEALLGVMQQMYDAMKAIVDNLKPSDKELENKRRRMEEVRELRELLLARKIDFEEARQRFINLLDPEDVAEFEKQADREAWKIMG